ncbi:MAG: flagellar basal body L-ring protein FlgH [Chloroflexota bacterium]
MRGLIIAILLFPALFLAAEAQFAQNSSRSLFSDVKAFKQGDAVTVIIVEDTRADNSATTSNGRTTELGGSVAAGSGSTDFDANANLGTSNNFRGSGSSSRDESIRSKLSARVVSVDQNGNLKIEGARSTKVNGETQKIIISGMVRPVDITSDNSVYSYNIMDLTLTIDGEGSVSSTQEPGLITKFFRILF